MMTQARLRQLWQNARYRRMLRELLSGRNEAMLGLEKRVEGSLPAAGLAMLHLAELRHAGLPLGRTLLAHVLLCQCRDGGWGTGSGAQRLLVSALCIRGLDAAAGMGWEHGADVVGSGAVERLGLPGIGVDRPGGRAVCDAVERGIVFVAQRQAAAGTWEDDYVTAVVLLELGRIEEFRRAVRVGEALERRHARAQTQEVRLAWSCVGLRCGGALHRAALSQLDRRAPTGRAPLFANVA